MWRTNIILQNTVPQFFMLLASLNCLKSASGRNLPALHPKLHHTNSQIRQIELSVSLYALKFGNLLTLRHKLVCQNHKICVSDILWETHLKPASLIEVCLQAVYLKMILSNFLQLSHPNKLISPVHQNKIP